MKHKRNTQSGRPPPKLGNYIKHYLRSNFPGSSVIYRQQRCALLRTTAQLFRAAVQSIRNGSNNEKRSKIIISRTGIAFLLFYGQRKLLPAIFESRCSLSGIECKQAQMMCRRAGIFTGRTFASPHTIRFTMRHIHFKYTFIHVSLVFNWKNSKTSF